MMCFLHCVWEFIKHRMEMKKKKFNFSLHVLLFFFLFKIERKSIFHLNFSEGIWVFLLLFGIRIPFWPFYSFLLNFQTKNRLNIIKKFLSIYSILLHSFPTLKQADKDNSLTLKFKQEDFLLYRNNHCLQKRSSCRRD